MTVLQSSMNSKLRDLIRSVRACKTAGEERAVIAKECAEIRNSFKDDVHKQRQRNVAKLLFIHMLGYPTHFGQMECLKLIASLKFPEKRVGYLGLSQLLDESAEILMLVTNSIKNDLANQNQFTNGVALCALGNIATQEMAMALCREVASLLEQTNPYLRKKAALCAVRVLQKSEEQEDRFLSKVAALLDDKNHGVLLSGCSLLIYLLQKSPEAAKDLYHLSSKLIRIEKELLMSGYASGPDYEVSGITDPFLQVKILKCLRLLGPGSTNAAEDFNDILAQVATNTDGSKNAGSAILYEVVQTILSLDGAEGGLRVLAINILGKFLTNKDNNIRYVSLLTLQSVVFVDCKAVHKHKATILECLKDADISIKRRALDVAIALVNVDNVKSLVKELVGELVTCDSEFKADLVAKICLCVQKYPPSKTWQVDTLIKVFVLAGSQIRDEILNFFCHLVASTPELQPYAVYKLFYSSKTLLEGEGGGAGPSPDSALLTASVWVLGEFGEKLVEGEGEDETGKKIKIGSDEILAFFESLLQSFSEVSESKELSPPSERSSLSLLEFSMVALAKLAAKIPGLSEKAVGIFEGFSSSMSLDLQQRVCEFIEIFRNNCFSQDEISTIFARIPVSETFSSLSSPPLGEFEVDSPEKGNSFFDNSEVPEKKSGFDLDDLLGGPEDNLARIQEKNEPKSKNIDILGDLFGEDDPAPPSRKKEEKAPEVDLGGGGGLLGALDDFGFSNPAPAPQPSKLPSFTAFEKNGVKIQFHPEKSLDKPDSFTEVCAEFSNSSGVPLKNFVFEAAVPPYLKLQIFPASSTFLSPGAQSVTQKIFLTNSSHGEKPLVLKIRVSYETPQGKVQEMGQVGNFPKGC